MRYVELRKVFTNGTWEPLTEYGTLVFDAVKGAAPSVVSFSYPKESADAAGLAAGTFLAVLPDGTEIPDRYVIETVGKTEVTDDGLVVNFAGRSLKALLEDDFVWPSAWPAKKPVGHAFLSSSAGTILKTLLTRSNERGLLTALTHSTFTGALDSAGIAWGAVLDRSYPTGNTLLQVTQNLEDAGLIDVRTNAFALEVRKAGGFSTHRSVDAVCFRAGLNILDEDLDQDAKEFATDVLIEGELGYAETVTFAGAYGTLGRRRARYVSGGGIADSGTLAMLAASDLDQHTHVASEQSLGVSHQDGQPQPFVDYKPGDWVWLDKSGLLEEVQVKQIAVAVDAHGDVKVGLTLGDLLDSSDEKLKRRIDAITGANAGNAGPIPGTTAEDRLPPAAPGLPTVSSNSYIDYLGGTQAQVTVSWGAVTTNADGTPATDIQGYEAFTRLDSDTADWQLLGSTDAPTTICFYSPLPVNEWRRFRVKAIDTTGLHSMYGPEVRHKLAQDLIAPGVPTVPTVMAEVNAIVVRWDGKLAGPVAPPPDFRWVELHGSITTNFLPGPATLLATFPAAQSYRHDEVAYSQVWYYKLIAVDRSFNASTPSAQASAASVKTATTDISFVARDIGAPRVTSSGTLPVPPNLTNDVWYDTITKTTKVWDGDSWEVQVDMLSLSALLRDGLLPNPIFSDWADPAQPPFGFGVYGTGGTVRETALVRTYPYACRFNHADAANGGLQWTSNSAGNTEYVTVTVDFQLVSGALGGAGVILDWNGYVGGRAQINLATEIPAPVLGKWYRVTKTLRRPPSATGTWTSMGGYLMGSWSGHGTCVAKNIVYDTFNFRASTVEEIYTYGVPTLLTAVATTVTTAQTAADLANEVARAMASGKMLNVDPTFTTGTNGVTFYNNLAGGAVTVTRIAKPADCPSTSGFALQVTTAPGNPTSPGIGGFTFSTVSRANAILITRFVAKIPVGSTLSWASNATGTGGSSKWLTSNAGTGNYAEYIYKVVCGATGTFAATNYFYLDTGALPLSWYVAYATVLDVTDSNLTELKLNLQAGDIGLLQGDLTDLDGKVDGKAVIYVQSPDPDVGGTLLTAADKGDIWINNGVSPRVIKTWDGNAWIEADDRTASTLTEVNKKSTTFFGTVAPTATAIGDLWVDSTGGLNVLKRATAVGTGSWVSVQDKAITDQAALIGDLQEDLTTLDGKADGKARIFVQLADPNTPPGTLVAGDKGDVWINDGATPRIIKTWSGTAWLEADARTADALTKVAAKSTTFWATTAPTATAIGDLWFDTTPASKMALYRASALTAVNWVLVRDLTIETAQTKANDAWNSANGKSKVTVSANPPGATANAIGDVWWQKVAGALIGQWEGAGTTVWTPVTLSHQVISSIDAATIGVSLLTATQIDASGLTIAASQLASGTMGAGTTMTTNAGNARVTLSPTGLKAYDAAGANTVHINSAGDSTFVGKITVTGTGSSVPAAAIGGALLAANIPNLDASKISGGTLSGVGVPGASVTGTVPLATSSTTTTGNAATATTASNVPATGVGAGTLPTNVLLVGDNVVSALALKTLNTSTIIDGASIKTGTVIANRMNVTVGGGNVLLNSSFEAWTTGAPDSWAQGVNVALSQIPGRANGLAVRLSTTSATFAVSDAIVSAACAELLPNAPFVVSFSARRQSGTGGARYGISGTVWNVVPLTTSWARYAFAFPLGAATANQLFLAPEIVGAWIDIDEVQVEPGDMATAWTPNPAEILPGTIRTEHLATGSVTADRLDSELVIAGSIKTAESGARVELGVDNLGVDVGVRLYSATSPIPTVNLPTQGVAHFDGSIDANGLRVLDGLSVMGKGNNLAADSITTMSIGVTAPVLPPTVLADYESHAVDNDSITYTYDVATSRHVLTAANSSGTRIYVYCYSADWSTVYYNITMAGMDWPRGAIYTATGYWALKDVWVGGACTDWNMVRYSLTDGAVLDTYPLPTYAGASWPMLGKDASGNLLVAQLTSTLLVIRTFNPVGGAIMATYTGTRPAGMAGAVAVDSVLTGDFDFGVGAGRYVVTTDNLGAFVFSRSANVLTNVPNESFPLPVGGGYNGGLGWDGTVFWSMGGNYQATKVYKHTTIKWTTENPTWWASYAWGQVAGGFKTLPSPKVPFAMLKRARLTVTASVIPLGTNPAIDSAWTYVGRRPDAAAPPSDPANGDMHHDVPTPVAGARAFTQITAPFSGAVPLTAGTFAAGTASQFVSAGKRADTVTPKWTLSGDGSISIDPLVVASIIPAELGAVAKTITDWNSAVTNGTFMAVGAANSPDVNYWWIGQVMVHNSVYVTQTVTAFTVQTIGDTSTYRRSNNGAGWGGWYKLRLTAWDQAVPMSGARWTQTGSAVAIPNGSGDILINFPLAFSTLDYPVACTGGGTSPIICDVFTFNANTMWVRCWATTGALVTSGNRRINWSASGILA